jgi:SagB-type dehydrogenase family enzyme
VVHRPVARYRRAESLVCYWDGTALVAYNYLTRVRTPAPVLAIEVLNYCEDWRTIDDVRSRFACPVGPLKRLLRLLAQRTLLDRHAGDGPPAGRSLTAWEPWMPDAAVFHFGTKDVRYGSQRELDDQLVQKAASRPPPAPVKAYVAAERRTLPPARPSEFAQILTGRRTWRRFGAQPVSITDVATLLGHTFGVQQWAMTRAGRCALKSSPSGGARHPIEAYLLARRVAGLPRGCYYYDPDAHDLALIKSGLTSGRLETYLANQPFYRDVPAVVVMTAVFGRSQWRYEFPRAYRVVLLDAGHLCQTFLLVATSLGLAPFCTAALADSAIERDLRIDGVNESVIYACGVGVRPPGVAWAPWAETTEAPPLQAPKAVAPR